MFPDPDESQPQPGVETPGASPFLDGLPEKTQREKEKSVRQEVAQLAGVSPSCTWDDFNRLVEDGASEAGRVLSALTVMETGWLSLPSIHQWLREFDLSFYRQSSSLIDLSRLHLETENILANDFSADGTAKAAVISTLVLGDTLVRQRDLVEDAGVEHQVRLLVGTVADTYFQAVGDYLHTAESITLAPGTFTTTKAGGPPLRIPSPKFLAIFQTFMFSLAIGSKGTACLAPFKNQASWVPEEVIPDGEFANREWPGQISPIELEHWIKSQVQLARIAETFFHPPQ